MESISLIEYAWALYQARVHPNDIAQKIGKHRATVYRWISQIKRLGIREFLRRYQSAKTGHRQKRKTDPIIKKRIYAIREKYHYCCGEKIKYWLWRDYQVKISVATIYKILGEKYILRSKWKHNVVRGPVPYATRQREVIQHDTVDFGGLFAFTSIDIFTRETQVVMRPGLKAQDGLIALNQQMQYFQFSDMLQCDGGSEFKADWSKVAKNYCHRVRTARPYKKNEQAYIESFNRTLRKECLGWGKYRKKDLKAVQAKVDGFIAYYNNVRPHLSLELQSPKEYLSHLCL